MSNQNENQYQSDYNHKQITYTVPDERILASSTAMSAPVEALCLIKAMSTIWLEKRVGKC